MKTIVQRALSLATRYTLTDKKYIPLLDGCGTTCDNCGKLIANIATVKNESGESFNIGFDCLETMLINNSLLSSGDVIEYERVKAMIPKILRFAKRVKDVRANHVRLKGLSFEVPKYPSDYFVFYWLQDQQTKSRDNDFVKLKGMEFDFLLETLRHIFPSLNIYTQK